MKHAFKISSLIFVLVLAACGKKPVQAPVAKSAETPQTAAAPAAAPAAVAAAPVVVEPNITAEFDVSSVAITSKDLGKFPYLNAPERFKYSGGSASDLGREYFAIKGKLVPKDGKSFKAYIRPVDRERDKNNIFCLRKVIAMVCWHLGLLK